jgi:hypothetical protein
VLQTYTGTHYPSGTLIIKNLNSSNAEFTVSNSLSLVDCRIYSDTFALSSSDGATINIETCTVYGGDSAIQSTGNTRISDSTINGICIFDGPIDADHCKFGAGSTATDITYSDMAQITNCQIKNPIVSKDTAGVFGHSLICNNIFIGVGTVKPNYTIHATTAGSVIPSINFSSNMFTGNYDASTLSCTSTFTGAGTFAVNPKILISKNTSTSSNLIIRETRGCADVAFVYTLSGGAVGVGSLNFTIINEIFTLSTVALNATDALVSMNSTTTASLGALGKYSTTGQVFNATTFGALSPTGTYNVRLNFEIYR